MSQQQNRSNQPEVKVQFKAKNVYKAGGSPKNASSNISNQKKTTEYKKINNTTTNKEKIIHRSVRRNIDPEGNAIITTKIVREVGSGKIGNNLNSRSMINAKANARNISYGINNDQENKYMQYSNFSKNEEENQGIMHDRNYEIFSPCSYNSQFKQTQKYSEYYGVGDMYSSPGLGGVQNLKAGQISPVMPNYVRSNEYMGQKSNNYKRSNREYISNNQNNMSVKYNNYNMESPYNLSKYSISNDFNSPDRQYECNSKQFRSVQIEKIKGKQPIYHDKMNIRNNQVESSSVDYNGYPERDEELYEMIDNMATLIQSHVRGFLVRKKVLRYITLAIYYQSFCDKIQDVLCIHVRNEVFQILKNKLKNININNKYGNKNISINISNISSNNKRQNQDSGRQMHTSKSYYQTYKTDNNYNFNNNIHSNHNPNINNYSTRKEVYEYSSYRNTPLKGSSGNNYSEMYETSKVSNIKKLKKNASYQNNLTSNFNHSHNTYNKSQKAEKYKSPSTSRVIHYFVNSPCTSKTPHQRYYHEISTKTTNVGNYSKDQLNSHRSCHKCDEIRKMKKQEKFYITTTTEKREDEYEKYEYEKNMKYNKSTNDIFKDNKIAKVESINIKTSKRQKTEQEIEEEINRRVKISVTEYEKIEREKRMKEEQERKEKERIQREREKEKERERKEKEEQMKKERMERERERKEKEEQMKRERMERERERKEKEEQIRRERKEKEEQMKKERLEKEKKEKEKREEQIRIEKEKEKKRRELLEKERKEKEEKMKKEREEKLIKEREERKKKEEQMRIEKEKQKKLKEEQMRLEQEKRDIERVRKLQEEISKQTIKKTTVKKIEEKKINMSDYILKKDCQKNIENMKTKLEKEYEKKIAMEKKKGLEEQKRYEEKIEIQNRKEIERIMEQQKRKEIERQREIEKEKELQKRKELELQKQREKEIQQGIKEEMEKQKELMKQKELEEKNKKMKQMKINKVQEVNFKSLFPNSMSQKKVDEKIIEKNKEKALAKLKKYILFRGNYLLKLRKYFNDWRINVKNLVLQEYSKAIQDFCRVKLEITGTKRAIDNWKKIGRKIYYKRRVKLLKMRPKVNIKKKKLYELLRITKLNRAFSRRRYIHYLILVWYIYAKNVHRKRVNMKFLYENLLRTYMSLAKDIFGNNQFENPSVQDAMYEAVNTNKFSTSYQDDVPLARKHYAEMRKKKLLEEKNKGQYSVSTTKIEIEKNEVKKYYSKEKVNTEENEEDELSIEAKRKKELLNKFRKYKSMRRDLYWKKQNKYIASIENEENKEHSEEKDYKKINNNDYKINKSSTTMKKTYEDNKLYSKPIENKYNTNKYNTSNYNSNINKVQGQKKTEIKEYKKMTEDNKYNNTSYPSRKNKSENKDIIINKVSIYNNTNPNINTNKYTTTQTTIQKTYSTLNKPSTSGNSNIKTYSSNLNISTNNNNIKISPNTGYKKTEVTKTIYTKEEIKPYTTKQVITKTETTGNNANKTSNVTIVSSSYHKATDNNNKTSYGSQSKYMATDGNNNDKKVENKYVTTKIEKKVEIKSSGNAEKDEQGGKKLIAIKSYQSNRTNK